jgi:subtilisin family serine protease
MRIPSGFHRAARVFGLAAVALGPGTVTASPTEPVARLDPYLARAAALAAAPNTPSAAPGARAGLARLDRIVGLDLSADPPAAIVRVAGRPTDRALARIGARRISRGHVTELVWVRLRDLPALAALPGVVAVESLGRLERRLDVAGPLVGATALHAADPSVTGAGVVYGSIDDGIDIRHPTFRNPDGTTRVEAFWDVCDESGRPPPGFEELGGTLYTREDIDAALAGDEDSFPHVDFGGHGTMTGAIGAGSGNDGEYVGMAPGAAIVVVVIPLAGGPLDSCENQDIGLFGSVDSLISEPARFIEATAADRPFVINMSLGEHLGPHDGTSLLDTELEAIATAAPGRALVAAAGNEGRGGLHAGVLLPADGTIYDLNFGGGFDDGAALELWYPPDAQIEVRVRQASDCVPFVPTSEEELGDVYYIDNARLGVDARNGDHVAFVEAWGDLAPAAGDAVTCTAACEAFSERCDGDPFGAEGACIEDCVAGWSVERVQCVTDFVPRRGRGCNGTFRECLAVRATLELRAAGGGDVRVDVYATGLATAVAGEEAAMTIGGPASSRGVIAVGAFVHRAEAGQWPADGALGDITDYSSQGPMRDGRTKPEIAAPAELITSALATGNEPFGVEVSDDGFWMTTSGGTSAASPGVAGAIALLLEVHPELDLAAIHEAIALGALEDGRTGGVPNDAWGWGKLQIERSLATLEDAREDADGDGFGAVLTGGLDCDDATAGVHPRAAELGGNDIDDDCDGDVDEPLPSIGFFPRSEPVCADELPPDAGVDAGEPTVDAGEVPEADAGADDGGTATPDAAPDSRGGVTGGGGCSCRVAPASDRDAEVRWLLGVALGLAGAWRRVRSRP